MSPRNTSLGLADGNAQCYERDWAASGSVLAESPPPRNIVLFEDPPTLVRGFRNISILAHSLH